VLGHEEPRLQRIGVLGAGGHDTFDETHGTFPLKIGQHALFQAVGEPPEVQPSASAKLTVHIEAVRELHLESRQKLLESLTGYVLHRHGVGVGHGFVFQSRPLFSTSAKEREGHKQEGMVSHDRWVLVDGLGRAALDKQLLLVLCIPPGFISAALLLP
jgi:hypothetical protein